MVHRMDFREWLSTHDNEPPCQGRFLAVYDFHAFCAHVSARDCEGMYWCNLAGAYLHMQTCSDRCMLNICMSKYVHGIAA